MLKIGVVGVGGISRSHIAAWTKMDDAQLTALCDVRPEMMEKYPDIPHYTDFEEMLEKENLDILDICLPTYLHADYAVKAMEKAMTEDTLKAKDYASLLMYQAMLMAELPLEDPYAYTELVCRLMV